jgi:hypothetical protein
MLNSIRRLEAHATPTQYSQELDTLHLQSDNNQKPNQNHWINQIHESTSHFTAILAGVHRF